MSALFWIIAGAAVVAAACSGGVRNAGEKGEAVRIDRSHLYNSDDCECSVCGARFRKKGTVCPSCGTRFAGTREDDEEFIEEMVVWDDDD